MYLTNIESDILFYIIFYTVCLQQQRCSKNAAQLVKDKCKLITDTLSLNNY